MKRFPIPDQVITAALSLGSVSLVLAGASMLVEPAAAQMKVFDPTNYTQNLLTAARTLQQVNNQIQSLQNEAQSLVNQAKNLTRIDFPQLQQLQQQLQEIDRLMGQAQGIDFRIDQLDARYRQLFPESFDSALQGNQRALAARNRLDSAMSAFRQAMGVQSQIVGNIHDDAAAMSAIVARSQGAEGSLQAQQATNQLLALTAKQQFQIQNLMAAQFRSDATEQARRGQIEREARASTDRFLGNGKAYTPLQ